MGHCRQVFVTIILVYGTYINVTANGKNDRATLTMTDKI
jgi:hypothetical protein